MASKNCIVSLRTRIHTGESSFGFTKKNRLDTSESVGIGEEKQNKKQCGQHSRLRDGSKRVETQNGRAAACWNYYCEHRDVGRSGKGRDFRTPRGPECRRCIHRNDRSLTVISESRGREILSICTLHDEDARDEIPHIFIRMHYTKIWYIVRGKYIQIIHIYV